MSRFSKNLSSFKEDVFLIELVKEPIDEHHINFVLHTIRSLFHIAGYSCERSVETSIGAGQR